ncbi:hypothetical protein [Fluviicola sp.]|uniref:hypothetical protein n=1 Tax=Fluviicola sp. TaxID=1917219 RepID=UPI0031D68CD4
MNAHSLIEMDTIPTLTDLQRMHEDGTKVPFRIVGINEKGFFGKVYEHNAFVPFYRMPFEYSSEEVYALFLKSFAKVIFQANIFMIQMEKEFCILDLKDLKFEPIRLKQGRTYNGTIIYKNRAYLIIEMGALFAWKYGSVTGFLPKSLRDRIIPYDQLEVGDTLPVCVHQVDQTTKTKYLLQGAISSKDWTSDTILELSKRIVPAKVTYRVGRLTLIVDGKHQGQFSSSSKWYKRTKFRYIMTQMIDNLQEGEDIFVKVVGFNKAIQNLEVEWVVDKAREVFYLGDPKNTIADLLKSPVNFPSFED